MEKRFMILVLSVLAMLVQRMGVDYTQGQVKGLWHEIDTLKTDIINNKEE